MKLAISCRKEERTLRFNSLFNDIGSDNSCSKLNEGEPSWIPSKKKVFPILASMFIVYKNSYIMRKLLRLSPITPSSVKVKHHALSD
jgi:hypothetical protein